MTDPIHQLASEALHDSSGKFSLDLLAARRKLGKLSQAQPGLMLGKLVQAGVAGQASALEFTIGSSQIKARLHFESVPANQELVQKHVALAVALAQSVQPSHLSWECAGQEYCLLTSAPDQLPTGGPAVFHFRARSASFWESLKELLGQRHNSQQLLYERCLRCPIPVTLDSRRLNNPTWSTQVEGQCDLVEFAQPDTPVRDTLLASTHQLKGYGITWLNGQRFQAEPLRAGVPLLMLECPEEPKVGPGALGGLLLAKKFEMVTERDFEDGPTRLVENELSRTEWHEGRRYLSYGHLRARTWARMMRKPVPSTLLPVVDGLQLEKVKLNHCPAGCTVIRAVSDLAVDLDQLNLVQDQAFREMESELAVLLERCLARWKG